MLDFTSALYLGMRHPTGSLQPWERLTTGVPAALASPPGISNLTRALAELQGCERATVGPSTLHLFWDLFGQFEGNRVSIYMDSGVYPIARWGIERAAARGARVYNFSHHDADALERALKKEEGRARPLIVTDGFCPACGKPAPIARYLAQARARGGILILDDTQAMGILGSAPGQGAPYGRGGGGMMRYSGISGPDLMVISSLAKGFGVPMAVLSGSASDVERFETKSDTRVHCSPPSVAVFHAAAHALFVNRHRGEGTRFRLARLVSHFRKRLAEVGLSAVGGLFPVQTLKTSPEFDPMILHERLLDCGIRTVLRRSHGGQGVRLTIIITALHHRHEIDFAVAALARGCRNKN